MREISEDEFQDLYNSDFYNYESGWGGSSFLNPKGTIIDISHEDELGVFRHTYFLFEIGEPIPEEISNQLTQEYEKFLAFLGEESISYDGQN